MKVWSDFSMIVKLAAVCLLAGFIVGLCASGTRGVPAERPDGSPPSAVSSATPSRH
jgi:hypothetical protein